MRHFIIFFCTVLLAASGAVAEEAYPVIFEATQHAVLSVEMAGALVQLSVEEGKSVKKGDTIAKVDTGDLALRKKRSELSLKHLEVKVSNLERLGKQGLATNEELAEARMEKDIAHVDIAIFERQISKSYIRAPFNGVVVRRHVQEHEWVTAGQPVVELVDTDELRAVGNIPSRLAVGLKKGDAHQFYVHDLDISVSGTIMAVVPSVDEVSNTAQVIWKVKKPEKALLSGMKGEVRIGS